MKLKYCLFTLTLAFASLTNGLSAQPKSTVYRLSPLGLADDRHVPGSLKPLAAPLAIRIAPGQRDDLVVALAGGEQGFSGVSVELTPLKSPGNSALVVPPEEIRTVVCAYVPTGGISGPPDWNAKEAYHYEPYALFYDASIIKPNHTTWRNEVAYTDFPDDNPPLKPRDVPARELRQWYVTIPVPLNAKPGKYTGSLVFKSAGAAIATVAVAVEVLPIKLLPPAKLYGMYQALGLKQDDPRLVWVLKDFAEHGFHNPMWDVTSGPDFAGLGNIVSLSRQAGLDPDYFFISDYSVLNPYAAPQPEEKYREYGMALMKYWKTQSPLPLVWYGQDEASGETLKNQGQMARPLRQTGLNIGAASFPGYFAFAGDWMNYPVLAGYLNPDALSKADVAQARAKGATVLSYGSPMLSYHDPLLYRLRTGFNLWNNIYDGWCPWVYATTLQEHQDGTVVKTAHGAGGEKTHGVVLIGKQRIIPQVEWPAMRQGVDDVRYATTLGAQVLKARKLGIKSPAVDAAATLLRGLGASGTAMDAGAIEGARARVTDALLALQQLDSRLNTRSLGENDPKSVARKVNTWILPKLSFRPFPMGMTAVGEDLVKMRQEVNAGKNYDAMMAGYTLMERIEQARKKGTINDVESYIAQGEVGPLLVDGAERTALLGTDGVAYKNYFNDVADLAPKPWVFRPDREDMGLQEKWYEPAVDKSGWKPIDVTKYWQQQGNPDWVELEGTRIGYMGIGWYSLKLDVPQDWAGRKLYLWFTCDEDAVVWVNGKQVRSRDEGASTSRWYVPSLAPLSEALRPGESNTIVVRVLNAEQAGGLWRGVRVLEPKK